MAITFFSETRKELDKVLGSDGKVMAPLSDAKRVELQGLYKVSPFLTYSVHK
jgi:hypothetical protein